MSIHPSRQPLIRISKNGEMRLKNKVSLAILKENAYEERALGTQLLALKKHKARQDKYMTYRQLDFASKQIAASEERPHTIASSDLRNNAGLPPIQGIDSKRRATASGVEMEKSQDLNDTSRKGTQGNWEKAVMMVRMLKSRNEEKTKTKTFVTQHFGEHSELVPKESKNEQDTKLPLLFNCQGERPCQSKKEKAFSRQLTLPEMIKISREKSMIGIQDPRFLKLESCLGGESARSARSRFVSHEDSNANSTTDVYRKRKLKTS